MRTMEENTTNPADDNSRHSGSDLDTIGDLVIWNQMPHFSVRRLTQLNSPRWSMWDPYNVTRIAKARTLDDTRDWYFPIIVRTPRLWGGSGRVLSSLFRSHDQFEDRFDEGLPFPDEDMWWSWSGVWHSSPQETSDMPLPLPPLTHLPSEWRRRTNPRSGILASAGGLLLIEGMSGVVPVRRSKRLNPVLADPNPKSISDTSKLAAGTSNGRRRDRTPQSWRRLLVCNPLTKECRELPAADCQLLGLKSWQMAYQGGVEWSLVVDEEANSYQVILTANDFVALYTSSTSSWNCVRFQQERSWGRDLPRGRERRWNWGVPWEIRSLFAKAHLRGRLYFADVLSTANINVGMEPTMTPIEVGTLQLFEVYAEAGRWDVVQKFTLRKFHIPCPQYCGREFPCDMNVLPYVAILECNGDLYAVLAAKIHDVLLIGEEQSDSWKSEVFKCEIEEGSLLDYMPICFYIVQLQGLGEDFAVLRIQVPRNRTDFQSRLQRLKNVAKEYDEILCETWLSSEARGSVIWVACEDYLLSFDVVSRESKMQILTPDHGAESLFQLKQLGLAYRPSLHMKP